MPITPEQQAALRRPFPDSEVGKLPRLWCGDCRSVQRGPKQCDKHKSNQACRECGQKHGTGAMHLDYVGHAEVTDRLLAVDPEWTLEPLAFGPDGLPVFDRNGGLWARLTILGVTRTCYGDAPGKAGGDAVKEVIGDAIRNGAMRFGVSLDLWRKTEWADRDAAKLAVDAGVPIAGPDEPRQQPAPRAAETPAAASAPPATADNPTDPAPQQQSQGESLPDGFWIMVEAAVEELDTDQLRFLYGEARKTRDSDIINRVGREGQKVAAIIRRRTAPADTVTDDEGNYVAPAGEVK